jgi:hypothetical protein
VAGAARSAWTGITQQPRGDPLTEALFADPGGTDEEEGGRELPRLEGAGEALSQLFVAIQRREGHGWNLRSERVRGER